MKKTLLYCLTAIFALGFASCKEDEIMGPANPAEDYDRMPMTMFRLKENTNVDDDPYGMRVLTDELNSVVLAWYGVSNAAGYEIKFGPESGLTSGKEEDWTNPERLYQWEDGKYSKIVPPDQLTLVSTTSNMSRATVSQSACFIPMETRLITPMVWHGQRTRMGRAGRTGDRAALHHSKNGQG